MKTRYRSMVKRPITTLSELFDGGGTYNHAWSGGPLTMLHQYAAGLETVGVAYNSYQVLPQMGSLKSIDTVVPSPKGIIRLSLRRADSTFEMELHSPKGAAATIGIPGKPTRITLNGTEIWANGKPKGDGFIGADEHYVKFRAASGESRYRADY